MLLIPKYIIEHSKNILQAQNLLKEKEDQVGLCETELTKIEGKGFIVLDYGEELCGGIRIATFLTAEYKQVKIRIRFGESLSEAYSELGEKNSMNAHSLRDFETDLVSYSSMTFGQTGFRFVRIDFLEDVCLSIKSINASEQRHNLQPIYEYKGKDNAVCDIFLTAKRTIDLCMQDYLWDGIKRDRLVWIGDMHPEMLAVATLYGRQPIIEKSIDFIKKQTPLPNWMNRMPMYSLWWIIILADYYRLTNCFEYLQCQIDYLRGLLELINDYIDENGDMHFSSYFVDWQTKDTPDEQAGARAICIWGVKSAIELQNQMGIDTSLSRSILGKLMRKPVEIKSSKQAIGLKYTALGEISENERQILLTGGAKGLSTFMSYYILKAVAETSGTSRAVAIMKEYYGGMLSRGATTFWEDFNIEWLEGSGRIDEIPENGLKDLHGDFGAYCYRGFRHSLCHGWSAGVIKFIQEYVQ